MKVFGYYGSLDKYLKALGKRLGETVDPPTAKAAP